MMNISIKSQTDIEHMVPEEIFFIYSFIYFSSFSFLFAFWFPLRPINMSSESKHTWLIEILSRNSSIKVLLKYLQWLGSKCHFFTSTHYKCMETLSYHSNQTRKLTFIKKHTHKICKDLYDEYFYKGSAS